MNLSVLRFDLFPFTLANIRREFEQIRRTENAFKSVIHCPPNIYRYHVTYEMLYLGKLFCTTKIGNLHQIENKFWDILKLKFWPKKSLPPGVPKILPWNFERRIHMIKALFTLMFLPFIVIWKIVIGTLKLIGFIDIFSDRH